MKNKFYITTPIYYVNANPHIGHAYTTISADILARFNRMIGNETFFLTGTDEHGEKIMEAAQKNNQEPQAFTDEISAKFELTWDSLNISNDNFIRTTSPKHKQAVQNALQKLFDQGLIYKGEYIGLYCVGCEQYKTEKDLVDGLCADHQKAPIGVKESSYMFKLSAFSDILKKKITSDELKITPVERKNEILSFYEEGLHDISFSRKIKWGIELPWDKTQTAYVWPDAFLNYLTGIGWDGSSAKTPKMWPADVQLMSKDIIRVHATIWPAILLALDIALPKQLFVHGFFLIDGQKMSKSIGNIIAPEDLLKKYGADATRYLLASATPFGHDGDIGWTKFDEKYNGDLANGLGNLVARSLTLAIKLKESGMNFKFSNKNDQWDDNTFNHDIKPAWKNYKENLENIKIDQGAKIIFEQVSFLDNYIAATKPWELIKTKDLRVEEILYNVLERLRHIALMLLPYMPETTDTILNALGLDATNEKTQSLENLTQWGKLSTETTINKQSILFPRI